MSALSEAAKDTARERSRRWYAANRERASESMRIWRSAHTDELKLAKRRRYEQTKDDPEVWGRRARYRSARKDEKRRYDVEYRRKNAAALDEKKSEWRQRNKLLVRAIRAAYKARRRAAERGGISTGDLRRWLERQTKVCKWCGAECAGDHHVDHIVPLSKGGKHAEENLAIACPSCNLRKNAKMPAEFIAEIERHHCDIGMIDK